MHAFPCGTSALDFVGTLRARRNDEPTEKLGAPAALDAWFTEAGLMDRAVPAAGLLGAGAELVGRRILALDDLAAALAGCLDVAAIAAMAGLARGM